MLVIFRSVGIILPSLLLMILSWTSLFKNNIFKRNAFMYFLSFTIAIAVGFLCGYKFSFWFEIAHFRRGIDINDLYPKIPGKGLMLSYLVYTMFHTPLPAIVSVSLSSCAVLTWLITFLYQFTTPPMSDVIKLNRLFSLCSVEFILMFGLLVLCFLQNWYRENYARWDYLQREILHVKRSALMENQKTASNLLQSMLPITIIEKLKTGKPVMAEMYNPVTVIFAEICNFSKICESGVSPKETVQILNEVYTEWDTITDTHKVYKVETVGEVYMGKKQSTRSSCLLFLFN